MNYNISIWRSKLIVFDKNTFYYKAYERGHELPSIHMDEIISVRICYAFWYICIF
jgi:hypothetical protein